MFSELIIIHNPDLTVITLINSELIKEFIASFI